MPIRAGRPPVRAGTEVAADPDDLCDSRGLRFAGPAVRARDARCRGDRRENARERTP